jgi:GT2 family glycosyltransferase
MASISVVIPAYRCSGSIPAVLRALRAQTLQPLEIIVVDDCSPDNLADAIAAFREEVVYIRNAVNLGLSKTYNVGLRAAKGDYVLTLHSDCLLEPNYLELVWGTLSSHDDVAAVTGQYVFDDFQSMTLSDQLFSVLNLLPVTQSLSDRVEEIAFSEGKADLFRRGDLERVGYFDEHLVLTAEDQDLSAKFRIDGYRFLQDSRARFRSQYNGTQDALWKVLRKQLSYAQGQMYVLLKYGSHAIRSTTSNRNARALHRLSQAIFTCAMLGCLALATVWPAYLLIGLGLVAARSLYYCLVASPMRMPARLLAIPTGIASDALYTVGLLRGLVLFLMRGVV